jgi:hypothetical protein
MVFHGCSLLEYLAKMGLVERKTVVSFFIFTQRIMRIILLQKKRPEELHGRLSQLLHSPILAVSCFYASAVFGNSFHKYCVVVSSCC